MTGLGQASEFVRLWEELFSKTAFLDIPFVTGHGSKVYSTIPIIRLVDRLADNLKCNIFDQHLFRRKTATNALIRTTQNLTNEKKKTHQI